VVIRLWWTYPQESPFCKVPNESDYSAFGIWPPFIIGLHTTWFSHHMVYSSQDLLQYTAFHSNRPSSHWLIQIFAFFAEFSHISHGPSKIGIRDTALRHIWSRHHRPIDLRAIQYNPYQHSSKTSRLAVICYQKTDLGLIL
jgi:hypothetical protein